MRGRSLVHSAEKDALWRAAQALARSWRRRHDGQRRLPPLLVFTDPVRTPDPVAIAERLPPGAGVVFRHFGMVSAGEIARALAEIARQRRLILLIGDDEALAEAVGADGVHLPERRLAHAPRLTTRTPEWLITGAAHSATALARARQFGLDAAVLSPIFPSRSATAAEPLGAARAATLIREAGLPVYALGGVNLSTIEGLKGSGVCGIACVEALASGSP